ncbi:MAG: tetratricopeptide repeat protein, partial [Candidatus Sumerlaeia bacterium]|nr:tetratricopeptide repeat protein [Candidatus Sumerlaeia bacterium]
LYIEAGQIEQAIPYFVRARDNMPEKYRAYLGLGIASWKLGKISDAKDNLQRVLAMNPTHNEALLYLGSIYQDEKNYTAATDLYYTVIEQLQRKADLTRGERKILVQTLIKNGEIELALSRPRTAIEHFQKALTYESESPEAYFGMGQAFVLLKRYQAAEQNYLEAIKLAPQQPKYYLGLGILYHNFLKHTDKAIENYRKYIQLGGPDKITVNKWIMEIGGEPVPVSD